METTPPLRDAVTAQRSAIRDLSEALGRYRQAGASVQEAGSALDEADGPADRYLEASGAVAAIIEAALDDRPGDGDAAGRLMAAVTIDAKVAEQAALLAMMLEPTNPDSAAVLRELTEDEIADLGEQLDHFAEPLLVEIEQGPGEDEPGGGGQPDGGGGPPWLAPGPGGTEITYPPERLPGPLRAETGHAEASETWKVSVPWTGPVMGNRGLRGRGITPFAQGILHQWGAPAIAHPGPSGPDPVTVEPFVQEILHHAAEDMVKTAGAAVPFAHVVQGLLAHGVDAAGHLGTALVGLRNGWHALHRLALRAWQELMGKLGRWAAPARQVGAYLANYAHRIIHDLIIGGVSNLLGGLLDAQQVVDDGDALLAARPAAVHACEPVVEHHDRQRLVVRLLNKTLPVIFSCHAPAGGAAAATLLIFSAWSAHDHIDSPQLAGVRFPGNPGLLLAIVNAP